VYDACDVGVFLEDGMGVIKNTKVDFVIFHLNASDPFHPVEHAGMTFAVIVNRNNRISVFEEVYDRMGADIPATAGNQDFFHGTKKMKKKVSTYNLAVFMLAVSYAARSGIKN
jgi:hypothetical protein